MQFSNIVALLLVVLLVFYWWHAQGIRQIALATCRAYCKQRQLQLLDDTVSVSRLWFKRDEGGRWRGWRLFIFEFTSNGTERHRGWLVMLGERVENIEHEPYPI